MVYKNKIYVYGGCKPLYSNDLLEIDMKTLHCDRIINAQNNAIARGGHTLNIYDNKLLAFGGWIKNNDCTNMLEVFNFSDKKWSSHDITIPKLTGHSAVVYNDDLIIFGGSNSDGTISNKMYFVNLKTYGAAEKKFKGYVQHMSCHDAFIYDNKMFVVGGWTSNDGYLNNDELAYYDIIKNNWFTVEIKSLMHLRGAAANIYGNKLYMFGGLRKKKYNNELVVIDLDKFSLVKLSTSIDPLAFHSVNIYGTSLIITGGKIGPPAKYSTSRNIYMIDLPLPKLNNIFNIQKFNDFNILLKNELVCCCIKVLFVQNEKIMSLIGDKNYIELEKYNITKAGIYSAVEFMFNEYISHSIDKDTLTNILKFYHTFDFHDISFSFLNHIYGNDKKNLLDGSYSLENRLSEIYNKSILCDVTLISTDKQKFKAHKVILKYFSKYFMALFDNNFKDSKSDELVLDHDSTSIKVMLGYIY